jgi:hypothetical protein
MRLLADQQKELAAQVRRGEPTSMAQGLLGSSLFVTALFLYSRAVQSQGSERSTLGIRDALPADIRPAHDRLLELRNRHFAHYETSDQWEDHNVVLVLGDGRMGISYPNQRRYLRSEDAHALYDVLVHAQAATEAAYRKASAKLNMEINRLFDVREAFLEELGEYRFDPATFFSADELPDFVASLDQDDWLFEAKVNAEFKRTPGA